MTKKPPQAAVEGFKSVTIHANTVILVGSVPSIQLALLIFVEAFLHETTLLELTARHARVRADHQAIDA